MTSVKKGKMKWVLLALLLVLALAGIGWAVTGMQPTTAKKKESGGGLDGALDAVKDVVGGGFGAITEQASGLFDSATDYVTGIIADQTIDLSGATAEVMP